MRDDLKNNGSVIIFKVKKSIVFCNRVTQSFFDHILINNLLHKL